MTVSPDTNPSVPHFTRGIAQNAPKEALVQLMALRALYKADKANKANIPSRIVTASRSYAPSVRS